MATSMPQYLPFAGRNAIVEMAVGIQFQSPFDARISKNVDAVKLAFSEDFPKFEAVQQITLNVGPMAFPQSIPSFNGFILTKMKPDNTPARMLRVMGNIISVHFMEYDSWKSTRTSVVDYLQRCLGNLKAIEANAAVAVFLRYVDRFTFDGNSGDATARALFREDCRLLPIQVFSSGSQWHVGSGWYAAANGAKTLNNLNIVAGEQPTATITIDHVTFYPFSSPCNSLNELFEGSGDRGKLLAVLDGQHQTNAEILRALLSDKMLDTIGLSQ